MERLGSYWDKTNNEFNELYDSLLEELKDGTISEPANMGKSVGFLGYFDAMHFRELPEEAISDIRNRLLDIYPILYLFEGFVSNVTIHLYRVTIM